MPEDPVDHGGYSWTQGRHVPIPYNYTYAPPAGAMTVTAADMGRFMVAMLADGALDGERILSPASVRMFSEPQYTPHPRALGVPYGFDFLVTRGQRLDARLRAPRFAGTYRTYRPARNGMGRLRSLEPTRRGRAVVESDGAIRWQGRRWMEVEPLVFRSVDSADCIVFRQDASGNIAGLEEYERVGWWEQTWFQAAVFTSCVIAFLAYLLSTSVRFVRRQPMSPDGRTARTCAACVAGVNVIFVGRPRCLH